MSRQSLSDVDTSVKIKGIAPGTYQCNGTTYYGGNVAQVTAQAISDQANDTSEADWYVCDCGYVIDAGKTCTECIDFIEVDYQSYQKDWLKINGRLAWLPKVEPQHNETENFIHDVLLPGLPQAFDAQAAIADEAISF